MVSCHFKVSIMVWQHTCSAFSIVDCIHRFAISHVFIFWVAAGWIWYHFRIFILHTVAIVCRKNTTHILGKNLLNDQGWRQMKKPIKLHYSLNISFFVLSYHNNNNNRVFIVNIWAIYHHDHNFAICGPIYIYIYIYLPLYVYDAYILYHDHTLHIVPCFIGITWMHKPVEASLLLRWSNRAIMAQQCAH